MNVEDKGKLAKDLLDNPVLQMAVADLKQNLVADWSKSDAFDTKGREQAFLYHRTLDMILDKIQGYVSELAINNYNKDLTQKIKELV